MPKKLWLALVVLLAAMPAQAAKVHRITFAALSAPGVTAGVVLRDALKDAVTGTAQVNVTSTPTSCAYRVEGSLDGVRWFVLGKTSDCTPAADCDSADCGMFHFEAKTVDYIRGRLTAIGGGTAPTATLQLKLLGR